MICTNELPIHALVLFDVDVFILITFLCKFNYASVSIMLAALNKSINVTLTLK